MPDYRLEVTYDDGHTHTVDDPYRFLPTLGEMDLHLINEGRHEQLWEVLGARVHHYDAPMGDPISGTAFAVWAPAARAVRLKGDFNSWDGREHPMRQLGSSGVWELFVPGVGSGTGYKYVVLGADGEVAREGRPDGVLRRGPAADLRPRSSSPATSGATRSGWRPGPPRQHVSEPMSVYEMHLASWRRGKTWEELADELPAYLSDLGFTHVELMPVMQHPFGGSWGYHVTSYFAPDSRFGDPDGFRLLVDRLHQAGIGVILDWVPGHFATDEWALPMFDGTPLYEDPNPQRGWHKEWGSHIFNFGRHEVRNFLYANALYWLEEFHADGLRVDGVASMLYLDYSREEGEWTPNKYGGRENLEAVQFLQEMNATVYKRVPGRDHDRRGVDLLAAGHRADRPPAGSASASSGTWAGCTTRSRYVQHDPVHRAYHHGELTFPLVYAWSENYVLPISHDEVVHGKGSLLRKMPGDRWRQLANLRAYLAYMWAHPGKQLLFMGCELGQESEWAESRELDWWLLDHPEHRGVHSRGARPQPRLRRLPRPVGSATTTPTASSGSTPTTPAATSSRSSGAASPGTPDLVWSPTSPPSRTRATASACPPPGSVGRGGQHRRRDLHRLRRGQPGLDHRRSTATTSASRRTPTSWCRPWRPCGSDSRLEPSRRPDARERPPQLRWGGRCRVSDLAALRVALGVVVVLHEAGNLVALDVVGVGSVEDVEPAVRLDVLGGLDATAAEGLVVRVAVHGVLLRFG